MRLLVAAVALAGSMQPALAQESQGDVLHASYALWGMMDGMANFCAETMAGDFGYQAAYIDWLVRNLIIVEELDAALAISGEPTTLADEGRSAGSEGILELVSQATNPEEVCVTWRAETEGGGYEAETFLAMQLGILRERDGM